VPPTRNAVLALAAFAALCALAAPRAIAAPDPYQIFGNARAYWHEQRYPMLLDYAIAVDVTEGGNERVEHYRSEYDAVQGVVSVDPMSDYQLAHPVVPTPTPFNSAAIVDEIRKEFHDPNPRATPRPSPTPNGLEEIATVYAHNRDYTITLLGTDTIDGHACYHLALAPTRDPARYRIRQAWIDEQTYATWQLQDALNFISGPGTNVAWIIHFDDVDGAQYVREEDALAPMSSGGEIYTKTAVRFENLRTVDESTVHAPIVQGGTLLEEPAPV